MKGLLTEDNAALSLDETEKEIKYPLDALRKTKTNKKPKKHTINKSKSTFVTKMVKDKMDFPNFLLEEIVLFKTTL